MHNFVASSTAGNVKGPIPPVALSGGDKIRTVLESSAVPQMIPAHPATGTEAINTSLKTSTPVNRMISPGRRILQLEAALDTAPLGLATVDLGFRYLSVNRVFARMHGMQPADFIGRTVSEALPKLSEQIVAHLKRCLSTGTSVQCEMVLETPEKEEPLVILRTCEPVRDASGAIVGISAGLLDITERKRAETALRESEDNYRHAVELNPHIPWTCTPDGSHVELSPRWAQLTGLKAGVVPGNEWIKAIHPRDLLPTLDAWKAAVEDGSAFDVEYRVRAVDGSWLWVRARAAVRRDADGQVVRWYGILEDIGVRKQVEAALHEKTRRLELATEELALRVREDHLTGLANRRHFDEMLERELLLSFRTRQPLVLVMIDVDWFKSYNDNHGHVAGDDCLRRIGAMLRQITRIPADTVARYGGEEFVIVLPNTSEEQAMVVANRALEGARALALAHSGSPKGRVTISVGTAALDRSNDSRSPVAEVASALIEKADAALYAAKKGGRDRIVTSQSLALEG